MSKCTIINAHVTDQVLQLSNLPRIASGSKDALQIRCNFCGKWAGCGKTAVFYRDKSEVYHVPVLDNLVTVPWEVLQDEGYFWFGIMGTADLTRTTEAIRIEVAKGAITVATAVSDPTPDIYEQLMVTYGVIESQIQELLAMRSAGGGIDHTISADNGNLTGTIKGNGTGAHIELALRNVTFSKSRPTYETTVSLPDALIPEGRVVLSPVDAVGRSYTVQAIPTDDGIRVYFRYWDSTDDTLFQSTGFYGFYSVANPSLAELADARVGYNGTTYDSAGQAIREQVFGLHDRVGQLSDRVFNLEEQGVDGGEGNTDLLVVTYEPTSKTVTHTSAQIYQHIQNGGVAVLKWGDKYYTLTCSNKYLALFSYLSEADVLTTVLVGYSPNTCKVTERQYATDAALKQVEVKADQALDGVREARDYTGDVDHRVGVLEGKGVLVVTYDGQEQVSHNAEQIYQHIQNGGSAVLKYGDAYYGLSMSEPEMAVFSSVLDDPHATFITVSRDGRVTTEDRYFNEGGGEGGGSNMMVVTYNEETDYADHNAMEICEHIQNGGTAVLFFEDKYYNLSSCEEYRAVFSSVDAEDGTSVAVWVCDDNTGGVIRGAGGGGGGADEVLTVTVDRNNNASHNSEQIYEHVQNGGTAVMVQEGGVCYALSDCLEMQATFSTVSPQSVSVCYVNKDGKVSQHTTALGGGSGGGGDVLIVTQAVPGMASHTTAEIFEHVQNGGTVVAHHNSEYYTLDNFSETRARFCGYNGLGDINYIYLYRSSSGNTLWSDVVDTLVQRSHLLETNENVEALQQDVAQMKAQGGGGGGGGALVVTLEDNGLSTLNASQIYAYLQNGGTAMFVIEGQYLPLTYCAEGIAVFGAMIPTPIDEEGNMVLAAITLTIDSEGMPTQGVYMAGTPLEM